MASRKPTKLIRVDEDVYLALVKHKTGMMTLGEMIRHSLEAFGYLEKKEDDPYWYQSRLLDLPPKKSKKE